MPQDFVRYAGASGDFNPIHYDEQYAHSIRNPTIFGQEMLTAGYASHLTGDWSISTRCAVSVHGLRPASGRAIL